MKGIEAKYTAKHIAKMIKHKRNMERKKRRASNAFDFSIDFVQNEAVANHILKEGRTLSNEFRAFMIHNAFAKNRNFTSAEVAYFNLGDNSLNSLKEDTVAYSRYMERFKRQQKAINIVRHTILDKNEVEQFDKWLEETA